MRSTADKAEHTGHGVAHNVKHAAGSAAHKVEHAAGSAKHKLGDAAHSVKHKAGDTAQCAPSPAAGMACEPRRHVVYVLIGMRAFVHQVVRCQPARDDLGLRQAHRSSIIKVL